MQKIKQKELSMSSSFWRKHCAPKKRDGVRCGGD